MSYFSNILHHQQQAIPTTSAEGAGLGPHTDITHRTGIKGDRLVNQLFACTFCGGFAARDRGLTIGWGHRHGDEPGHQRVYGARAAVYQAILRRLARHARQVGREQEARE